MIGLGRNTHATGGVTMSLFYPGRVQAVTIAGSLTDAQELALYNALATYMTAVGA